MVLATTPRSAASVDRTIGARGFDGAFADLAVHTDEATVRSTAKTLEYPLGAALAASRGPDLRVPALLVGALALAILAGLSPALIGALRVRRTGSLRR
jgi:hypothetical protein